MSGRIMVIGANGALGSDLMKVLDRPVPATHADFDICRFDAARSAIKTAGVTAVINTAAFHRVPECEEEYAKAFEVNVIGVRNLAKICSELKIHLCHISTDYVFDGKKRTPYTEEDAQSPLSIYAISKLAGEHAALAYADDVSVVRSCGLYGEVPTRAKGGNFVNTMIRLGKEKDRVSVVDDEFVCPTYTYDLAQGIDALLRSKGKGVFHITQSGEATWFEFAKIIFETLNLPAKLEPTKAALFQSVVKRPTYSILDNSKFSKLTGITLPTWQDALKRHLAALTS